MWLGVGVDESMGWVLGWWAVGSFLPRPRAQLTAFIRCKIEGKNSALSAASKPFHAVGFGAGDSPTPPSYGGFPSPHEGLEPTPPVAVRRSLMSSSALQAASISTLNERCKVGRLQPGMSLCLDS